MKCREHRKAATSPGKLEETGEYDLEGSFIRLGQAIDAIGVSSRR